MEATTSPFPTIQAPLQISSATCLESFSPSTTLKKGNKISATPRSRELQLEIPSTTSDQAPKLSERPRFVVVRNPENRVDLLCPGKETISTPSIIRDPSVSTVSNTTDHLPAFSSIHFSLLYSFYDFRTFASNIIRFFHKITYRC